MAITTYAQLQTAIATYHHRDDGAITDHIALAEKRINNALRTRLSEVESNLTATIDSRYIALPTGFMAARGLWLTTYGNRIEILFTTPEQLPVITSSSGQPYFYAIDGSNIAFDYPASQAFTYVFRYRKAYDIASTLTNHILTNYPNTYLYGALREAALLSRDREAAEDYEALFTQALEECKSVERQNRTMATLPMDAAITGNRMQNIITGDN